MNPRKLAEELQKSGWTESFKVRLLAARFYLGLETVETLQFARLTPKEINLILYRR